MGLNISIYFLLSFAALCHFTHADLIASVCLKSQDAVFCEKVLRSDPRASKADLIGLAQISIDKSKISAKAGVTLTTSLFNQAKDNISKEMYSKCMKNYNEALIGCAHCDISLKTGDILSLKYQASGVLVTPSHCDNVFEDEGRREPTQLLAQSKNLESLCDIILAIVSFMKS